MARVRACGSPSTFVKLTTCAHNNHLFKLIQSPSIYYGPWNLFDLRLGQAQLNPTKIASSLSLARAPRNKLYVPLQRISMFASMY